MQSHLIQPFSFSFVTSFVHYYSAKCIAHLQRALVHSQHASSHHLTPRHTPHTAHETASPAALQQQSAVFSWCVQCPVSGAGHRRATALATSLVGRCYLSLHLAGIMHSISSYILIFLLNSLSLRQFCVTALHSR